MFEKIKISLFGIQPAANVTNELLDRIILRDFENTASEVKQKLRQVKSDSKLGKNRISAAIIKLSNKDIRLIQHYIDASNVDFRDIISQAEYPNFSNFGFEEIENQNMRKIYWKEYSNWIEKT